MTNNYEWLALLHFDGPDDSTTFTDECGRLWTTKADGRIKTAEYKFGSSSFKGTANENGVIQPAAPLFSFFAQGMPQTVDLWFKTSAASVCTLFASTTAITAVHALNLNIPGHPGKLALYIQGNAACQPLLTTHNTFADNNWHHVAVVYDPFGTDANKRFVIYVDGAQEAAANNAQVTYVTGYTGIGGDVGFSTGCDAYIDEFAWRSGAVWTADFTPPTAAYTITAPTATTVRTVPTLPRRVP